VAEEQVFTVVGSQAVAATPITLEEAGLREREHLQEWVLANPEILGSGVLIITSESDRWESRGGAERDRLDILGSPVMATSWSRNLSVESRLILLTCKRSSRDSMDADVVEAEVPRRLRAGLAPPIYSSPDSFPRNPTTTPKIAPANAKSAALDWLSPVASVAIPPPSRRPKMSPAATTGCHLSGRVPSSALGP
jgi:hypothetical protein